MCLLFSLKAQTYKNWRCVVVHDGPAPPGIFAAMTAAIADTRVTFSQTDVRKQQFGHPWRQNTLLALGEDCTWVGSTNDDVYYAPTYLEWLLSVGQAEQPECWFVYADMVHSHQRWKPMTTRAKHKHLDLGGFLVRSHLVKRVPFDKYTFNGDGDWINRLAAAAGHRVQKVSATLYVHN